MNLATFYATNLKAKLSSFTKDERGDTNFISIIVILGVVIVVAGVFIGFGSNIIDWVNGNLLGNSGLKTNPGAANNPLKNL